ncbi:hypothetical protein T06_5658 [Trichinella sp. T6]|nr:hypothetical protein T06_5658 [Trichinella sp. T6]
MHSEESTNVTFLVTEFEILMEFLYASNNCQCFFINLCVIPFGRG